MKYRYHWLFKLLALVLAAVSGAVLLLGCAGLILDDMGFYESRRRGQLNSDTSRYCHQAARAVFDRFAWEGTGIEPKLFERFFRWGADVDAIDSMNQNFFYTIRDAESGQIMTSTDTGNLTWAWIEERQFDVRRGSVTEMPKSAYYPTFAELRSGEYLTLEGAPMPGLGETVTAMEYYVVSDDPAVNWENVYTENYSHTEALGADYTIYRMEYTGYESYNVTVCMTAEQVAGLQEIPLDQEFLPRLLKTHHDLLGPMAIWGGIVLVLSVLWLALVAGGSPHREGIRPEGLNLIPLDLYLCGAIAGCVCVVWLMAVALDQMVWNSGWGNYDGTDSMEYLGLDLVLMALCGAGGGGIIALFFMACAAQMKAGKNYWLKHTTLGLCWRYGWKFAKRMVLWCRSAVKKTVGWIVGFFAAMGHICKRFTGLLPLSWQWLIASGCLWLLMFVCILYGLKRYSFFALFFGIGVTVLLVLYGAYCFGALRDGTKKMSEGDLEEKIENKYLLGCFGEFAGHLNALGDACTRAAREQMKSERMKSELITNVSHDIKTPLTSIINYVDLLQKTDDEQQRKEYMEVLDRQSQRLKKLIEDLMEMSRANSGNVAVEITPTDVCEAVNQALGEFADTLQSCGLTVMLKIPAEPVMALCDGRHLWRVLSNTLSNVVKYAMPGTRVYVEVLRRGQKTEISIKNISAQMLNISAEELMERFVRGDSSRNTEGNGLGLNIAKSLMELQNGRLDLVVDGDLFKVVLTLNAV